MLERVENNGYRATALIPTSLVAEAPTRDEAVERIREVIGEKLAQVEIIQVEVPTGCATNPLLAFAGRWRDHPAVDQVIENMREYRRELEADPDRL
jgi:hypothetical protein